MSMGVLARLLGMFSYCSLNILYGASIAYVAYCQFLGVSKSIVIVLYDSFVLRGGLF